MQHLHQYRQLIIQIVLHVYHSIPIQRYGQEYSENNPWNHNIYDLWQIGY